MGKLMDNFWDGFEKQAGLFKDKMVSITGAEFLKKQNALKAAREAARAAKKTVSNPVAKAQAQKVIPSLKSGYSASFAEKAKQMNPARNYHVEGIGTDVNKLK